METAEDLATREGPLINRNYILGNHADRAYWDAKFEAARAFMRERSVLPSTLIEIATQHPLVNGKEPNEEFIGRLELGRELFEREQARGQYVDICLCSSRHGHEGVEDEISLSDAGINYLLSRGLPKECLHGMELVDKYKGEAGSFGSADECFVAASYFQDKPFGKLLAVMSPVQVFRKVLHYVEFGVLPLVFTAPAAEMYHEWIGEIFESVPRVLLTDPDLQSPSSKYAERVRRGRDPRRMMSLAKG